MTRHQIHLSASQDFDKAEIHLGGDTVDELLAELAAARERHLLSESVNVVALMGAGLTAAKGLQPVDAPNPNPVQPPPYQAPTPPAVQVQEQGPPIPADAPAWAQPPVAAVQPAVSSGRPFGPRGEQPHPTANCEIDGKPLYAAQTQAGRPKWQCLDWKWAGGGPNGKGNGHTMKWPNELQ